jgi:hypothetical protein
MRSKLTYSNVVSTLCLFLLVGGGAAYAASHLGKNTVGAKQLKKNAVTTAKLKKEAVTGAKVKKGTLTGNQINASTLGTVPNSQTAHTADTANAVAASEPWHEIGKPGEPQLEHECEQIQPSGPGANAIVAFYKDREGVVHLKGDYFCGVLTGIVAFKLPTGFRPSEALSFAMPSAANGYVEVEPDGSVECGNNACWLNGITFRAES